MMPPHAVWLGPGCDTHTRLTLAATPNAGTLRVKNGGRPDGDAPGISSRTPSELTSTIFADIPSIVDNSRDTTVRGDRRAGRPSASASAIDSRKMSCVAGRGIHAA